MTRALAALLLLVLTADALLLFLVPVMIYGVTQSLAWSGLAYAMAWLPRILLTPLVGAFIDHWGVRLVSVVSDVIKAAACLAVAALMWHRPEPLVVTLSGGLLSGLVAIGSAQSLIAYEKMIALASHRIDHDVNILGRIDQFAMALGPVAGLLGYASGAVSLLLIATTMYMANAICYCFNRRIPNQPQEATIQRPLPNGGAARLLLTTPALLCLILVAIGNNAFDGVVEASTVALIDRAMQLPIQYFAFLDICAGACGVAATLLYPRVLACIPALRLYMLASLVTLVAGASMLAAQGSLPGFLALYGLSIGGKVFMNNFSRSLRIRLVPPQRLARVASLMVLSGQAVLPIVGLVLYLAGDRPSMPALLMAGAMLVTCTGVLGVIAQCKTTHAFARGTTSP
ncbi:hypothetical protein [Pseudomonas sp. DC3000-4b1]|uniref:hypothetical protein n=1 Tax=unclassified Pseudomonas TaxID=196821 RepID=UPI003CE86E1A